MDLSPRQIAFLKSEMKSLEEDETRQPTARTEAGRIRQEAKQKLTE
jgi:hypothetical protein